MQADIASHIQSLATLPLAELRRAWQRHHSQALMPDRLPRDLLVRSIAWELQISRQGDFPSSTLRQLDRMTGQLNRSGDLDLERGTSLKPGTKLIREWRGKTIRVLVLQDGYQYDDRRYASLSHIATAITGTRWSGPRFFGLKQRKRGVETANV